MVIGVFTAVMRHRQARACGDDAVGGEEREQYQPGNQT